MTREDRYKNLYFDYLCNLVLGNFAEGHSKKKLMSYLHKTEFTWSIPMDENRALDGLELRMHFNQRYPGSMEYIDDGPCSMLEMLVALSQRIEIIMLSGAHGDRTSQWFWQMLHNMDISTMWDDRFDRRHVQACIDRFLDRDYEPNGKGGLFYLRDTTADLRKLDIWMQMCWYTNTIT